MFSVIRQKSLFLCISALILLLSAFLSFLALDNARRFHPDEAFYMTFSRNAAVNGDWLLISEPIDKTPLTFYTNALALVFFVTESDDNGVLQLDPLKGEFAGRMPSVLMSVILVAVMMQLVKSISEDNKSAYFAGILTALSPFRIVFAPTTFTDLPMLLFGTIALWMAIKNKPRWSGFWLIVSVSAKPQIVFYLPLILGILIIQSYQMDTIHRVPTKMLHFFLPIIMGIGILWGWDSLRIVNGAESFYLLGQSRYTATILTPLQDYPARFWIWWETVQYLFGHGLITVLIIGMTMFRSIINLRVNRPSPIIVIFWGWLFAFFIAHTILTLNLFDRNQIVLLPVIIILVSITLSKITGRVPIIMLFCVILFFSVQASLWQIPIGGDDGRHDGIDELADYLNSKPVATVIYDTWLDWELDYYMGQWTDKRRVFSPTPDLLLDGALSLNEEGTRYLVAPSTIDVSEWLSALENTGFTIALDHEILNFVVYSITPSN